MKKGKVFIVNTSKLMTGNIVGQAITIFAIPIITRLFTVDTYGNFAVFLSISMFLAPLSSLGLYTAILFPEEDDEAIVILILSLLFSFLFSALLVLAVYTGKNYILRLIGTPDMGNLIYMLPLVVWLYGSYQSFSYLQIRRKQFGITGLARITESVADRGIVLVAGFSGFTSLFILILGRIISSLAPLLYLFSKSGWIFRLHYDGILRLRNFKSTLKKHKNFVLYNAPSYLLISSMLQLPTVIISYFFSPAVAGLYAIGNRIVATPMQILGDALAKVYLQKAVESKIAIEKLRQNSLYLFDVLFSVMLIPFSLLGFFGDELILVLLGDKWHDAGVYIQILSCFAMSSFLARTFGSLFDVFGKQKTRFYFQLLNFFIRIGILMVGGYYLNILSCLIFYSLGATTLNVIAVLILLSYLGISISHMAIRISRHLLLAIPFCATLVFVREFIPQPFLKVFFIFLVMLAWAGVLLANNATLRGELNALYYSNLDTGEKNG